MTDFDEKARTWDDDPQKVERARRVAEAIATRVPELARMNVLEYGSGTGLLGFALQPRVATLTLADASREMTAVAREKIAASGARNVSAVLLDLTEGSAPATRYDLVCTLLTLHHIPDTGAILRRFHELLVPGGFLCVSDLEEEDGSFHPPGAAAHRGFGVDALAAQLAETGFDRVRTERVLEIEKETAAGRRRYPVFLAIARRR